jgi:hypothetical protein
MEAPRRSIALIFVAGAVSITMTEQDAPSFRAANATPWAAFPALTVQIPLSSMCRGRSRTALYAPRILNDPIGCSSSSLRYSAVSGLPVSARSILTSGVRIAAAYTAVAASRTSASVMCLLGVLIKT